MQCLNKPAKSNQESLPVPLQMWYRTKRSIQSDGKAIVDVMSLRLKSSRDDNSNLTRGVGFAELAHLTDEALMAHLRDGHHDALARPFPDRYHRLVLHIALRILRDAGEAEDLMQSVFLEIFSSAVQFDQARGSTKAWILQYAYHRSFNRRQYLNLRGIYERPEDSIHTDQTVAETNPKALGVLESARAAQEPWIASIQRRGEF